MENEVKLYMIFDILGDLIRSGPIHWGVKRERLEDVKHHTFDLILIFRLLKNSMPQWIDEIKIYDYAICHDLPEAITGDITKFQGISQEEKDKLTQEAIEYLDNAFKHILPIKKILTRYEMQNDIESKIVHMLDKVHSAIAFIKYETEETIDPNNPDVLPKLRNIPFVDIAIQNGESIADIFYHYHKRAICITEEERIQYGITIEEQEQIVKRIEQFLDELYKQYKENALFKEREKFPKNATIYNPLLKKWTKN